MPIFEHLCPEGHTTEEFFVKAGQVAERRRCNAILEDGSICKRIAHRVFSRCGVIFQPYAFAADGYASASDREKLVSDVNTPHVGNANKEAMAKQPNRSYPRFSGKTVRKVK